MLVGGASRRPRPSIHPLSTVLENSEGLSAEEKEHNVITKWKMLGNIKFVGKNPSS